MHGGVGPRPEVDGVRRTARLDTAVDREQRRAVERVEDVLRRTVATTCDHDAVGEPCWVGMVAPEDMNELVGNDAQPLVALGARRIDPNSPPRDLEVEGPILIAGCIKLITRQGEADVLALRGPDLFRPVLLRCEPDNDLRGPGSAVPAGPGSSPKPICQSRGSAMFRICTTRTASSTSSGGGAFGDADNRRVSRKSQQETVRKQLLVEARLGTGAYVRNRVLMQIGDQFGPRYGVGQLAMMNGSPAVTGGRRQRIDRRRGRRADMQDIVKVEDRCLRGVVGSCIGRTDDDRWAFSTRVQHARTRRPATAARQRIVVMANVSGQLISRRVRVVPGRIGPNGAIMAGARRTVQCQRCVKARPDS